MFYRPVPRRAPELVRTEADRLYRGDTDKVATTGLPGLVVGPTMVSSRYGSADELEDARAMLLELPARLRSSVVEMFVNSKGGTFTVTIRDWTIARLIGQGISDAADVVRGGCNGVVVVSSDTGHRLSF
jgi:hypothetical protein